MFINYILTALRSFRKHKIYPLICIAGLALAISCFITVILFIQNEYSYDQYHANKDRIFRIATNTAHTPIPLAIYLKDEVPEIEKITRVINFTRNKKHIFGYNNNCFYEDRYLLADQDFFDIFTYDFIMGNPHLALQDKNSIVLTESTAHKYFNREDPLGKSLLFDGKREFTVTGVIKDVPANSHFKFDLIASFQNYIEDSKCLNSWGKFNQKTYILAAENADDDIVLDKIYQVYCSHQNAERNFISLQKLTDIHLKSHFDNEFETNGSMNNIRIFSAIALIILLAAIINNLNLATAFYSGRVKEIGIRKAIGAVRRQIAVQYLVESVLISLIALIVALEIVWLCLPIVNNLADRSISLLQFANAFYILGLPAGVILLGILSGSYAAFYISKIKPSIIIKGQSGLNLKESGFRKYLLIVQFSVSIMFLIAVIVINQQLHFLESKDLGFDKEHLLCLSMTNMKDNRVQILKDELDKLPEVKKSSFSNFLLSRNPYNQSTWWEGLDKNEHQMVHWVSVDRDFIETFGFELIEGSNFTSESSSEDQLQYILNESALKMTGWTNPIGKRYKIIGEGTVVGIIKDFHLKSLHEEIQPCALVLNPSRASHLAMRINTDNPSITMNKIEALWKKLLPDSPFDYFFFDDDYNSLYVNDQRTRQLFSLSAIFAIIISGFGLFGLAAFMAKKRIKEIGIRKILGSSVMGIVTLLTREIVVLLFLANLIAWPVAFYIMNHWLQNFAYRIEINFMTFVFSGLSVTLIALVTICWHTARVALANPADALKHE